MCGGERDRVPDDVREPRSDREKTNYQVVVSVFAHEGALDAEGTCGVVGADGGDVDEEAGVCIDPAGVDHVQLVFYARDCVVWVDFQEICPSAIDFGEVIMVFRHVVVFRQKGDRRLVDLYIEIGIPR